MRDRAVALGWPIDRVHVIDSDLGLSGAQSQDRDGFQHLVTEVAMGHAGIVLGLGVSRLARNNADWHRLLELAALSSTIASSRGRAARQFGDSRNANWPADGCCDRAAASASWALWKTSNA